MRVTGIACVCDVETELEPGLYETFRPSAFAAVDSPEHRDTKLLLSHDLGQPLASRKAGTLGLRAGPDGLRFTALLPDTQVGRDTYESVRRGDLSGASIGFTVPPDGAVWEQRAGRAVRIVRRCQLFEVSITALGQQAEAYTQVVETRALEAGRALRRALVARTVGPDLRAARARLELAQARTLLVEVSAADAGARPDRIMRAPAPYRRTR
jgi:HK97 family phage prohead protease